MDGAETSIHDMRDVYGTASQWFEPKTFKYYMIFSFRDSSSGMDPASAKRKLLCGGVFEAKCYRPFP